MQGLSRSNGRSATPREGLPTAVAQRGFLSRLSPELIDELIQSSRPASYPPGFILETPTHAGLALIVSGALRYYLPAANGRQVTVGYLGPGNVIGSIQKESTPGLRIQVIAATTLWHLQADRVQLLIERRPGFTKALLDEATHGLRHSFQVLAPSTFTTLRARSARDIVDRANVLGPLCAGTHLMVTHQSPPDATGSVRQVAARAPHHIPPTATLTPARHTLTALH